MVRRFNKEDFHFLVDLHNSQQFKGMNAISLDTLPVHGMMCIQDGVVLAIGFLRMLEPCYAHIDTLVSNAKCSSELRHLGVSSVVDKLLLDCQFLGLKGVISHIQDKNLIKRAKLLGFRVVNEKILVKSI